MTSGKYIERIKEWLSAREAILIYGFPDPYQLLQEFFQEIQFEHVGPVTFCYGWVRMRFNKETICAGCDRGFGNGADQLRVAAGYS